MSSQTFPPQGGGGNTSSSGGGTAAIQVKPKAVTPTANNGKEQPKTDVGRTQLLADKQEGPRVVVQPAYPPMSMPKAFTASPPTNVAPSATKVNTPNAISTTPVGKAPPCYIIPAACTKGPQATEIAKAKAISSIAPKVTTKQQQINIPFTRSLLTNPVTTVRIPMSATMVSDAHHPKTVMAGLVATTPSPHVKTTIQGISPSQAISTTGVLTQGVLATMPYKGVRPAMHKSPVTVASAFASHLPKGAAVAAAAAMTAPRTGMTTALRAAVPIGSQVSTTTPTIIQPSLLRTSLQVRQVSTTTPTIIPPSVLPTTMHVPRLPAQVHLPGHMSNRVHSPASIASTTIMPRAPSPAIGVTPHPTAEPHRTVTHAAALQSLAVSAAQARSEVTTHATNVRSELRPDSKHDTKLADAGIRVDSRAEVRTGTRPEVRQQARVEVRTVDPKSERTVGKLDPRTDIRAGYTYQLSSAALNAQKQHSYMANMGIPRQQLPMLHSVTSTGATPVSSSAVTTQSTMSAVVRTTTVTATTMSSTHPLTTSSIPIAKVYPRTQHTTRATTEPSPTTVYLPQHRNSPNAAMVTSVAGLPTSVSMTGDTRTDRAQHQAMPPGHYPYYLNRDFGGAHISPYQHMMRYGQHGPLATMPNTIIRPTIDSHTRLPVHATTPNQNSSVAAAVAAAAHAATAHAATAHAATVANAPLVRPGHHGPLTMMIEPRGRQQVTMQNSIGVSSAADGSAVASALFLTSMAGGVYSTGQTALNSMAVAASQQSTTTSNPAASPRPSILQRKRATDSNVIRKPTVSTSNSQPSSPGLKIDISRAPAANSPKATDSLSSSQHSVDSNMSEMSTDTIPTPPSANSLRIKQEPDVQGIEAGPQVTITTTGEPALNATGAIEEVGPSPRKKPRKQQHIVATEHPDILDDQSTDEETETKPRPSFRLKKERKEKKHHRHQGETQDSDMDSMKIVHYFRRPCCRLLDTYRQTWKPTHNHFDRYTDVKPKEEKRISIHEIANQRGVLKKIDGWKIRHITYQFEDLGGLEKDVFEQMDEIKDGLAEYQAQHDNKDTTQIYELMQGNIQRSQYVMEHLEEAKTTMLKLLEHKPKVLNIIKKHANKRHAKKKSHSS